MNFTYENQGGSTFLVYAIGEGEQLDSTSVGMITNNEIPGLVKAVFTQMDANRFIKYNISSKIPVKQFFVGPINKKRLLGVCNGVMDAMLSAEEYMIDQDMVVIDTDYMFADVSTGETTLICLPIIRKNPQNVDLGAFFKHIMFTAQFDQTENCDYVAKIINYLNSTPTFSYEQFKGLLTEISTAAKSAPSAPGNAGYPLATDAVRPDKPEKEERRPQFQPAPTPVVTKAPSISPAPPIASAPLTPPAPQVSGWSTPLSGSAPQPIQAQDTGEKISLFYLLQHYNKENAATYKAQKEQKKAQKNGKAAAPASPKKQPKAKKQKVPAFAVPGQPAAPAAPFIPPESAPTPAPPAPVVPPASVAPVAPTSSVVTPPIQGLLTTPLGGRQGQVLDAFGDFGNTIILPEYNQEDSATVILGQGQAAQRIIPHLVRKHNNERIPITKPIFRLGRDVEFNDYAITDNKYVGHGHCHIVSRDGSYFVVDDNSKNCTFVDGTSIPPGQEVKLTHGCSLRLADEEFEFRLY